MLFVLLKLNKQISLNQNQIIGILEIHTSHQMLVVFAYF